MKNPFIKENNNGLWIAAAITGAIAAGTLAWFYIKRATGAPKPDLPANDYLKPKPGKHKKTTDLHELHTIVG